MKFWLFFRAAYSLQISSENSLNHAECAEYWKKFTFALKMINVIDEKQMYDSVIMGKENVFK